MVKVIHLKVDKRPSEIKRVVINKDGVYEVESEKNYVGVKGKYHKWLIVNGNIVDEYDIDRLTEKEAIKIWEERNQKVKQFKEDFFTRYKDEKVLVLRETTLEDRVNEILLGNFYYKIPIEEIFENLPNLEEIVDKMEDSWEAGQNLWKRWKKEEDVIIVETFSGSKVYDREIWK